MLDPKQKADELHYWYYNLLEPFIKDKELLFSKANQCALIAVDEILKVVPYISKSNAETIEQLRSSDELFSEYWQQVKEQLLKMK
jgi:hypothetical protein